MEFLNVINNACYAANQKRLKEDKHFSPVLKVSTKNLEKIVEIRIRDNGDGIPKSIREKLFNPFFTTKSAGTGLGLAIVHRIINSHHGWIHVKNRTEPDSGVTFQIGLPVLWR